MCVDDTVSAEGRGPPQRAVCVCVCGKGVYMDVRVYGDIWVCGCIWMYMGIYVYGGVGVCI